MLIQFNRDNLSHLYEDFYNATGVKLMIYKDNFSVLQHSDMGGNPFCQFIQNLPHYSKACTHSDELLLKKCSQSKKPERHFCHAGLIDLCVPMLHKNEIIGYVVLGQLKHPKSPKAIPSCLAETPEELQQLQDCYDSLPVVDDAKVDSIISIATMLAKYILIEDIITPKTHRYLERAVMYINQNLGNDLTVSDVSNAVSISKSSLYKLFHEHFHCTPTDYINYRRVEMAAQLLINTMTSIDEISHKVGFSSAAYFSRVFKQEKGISPLKYRQQEFKYNNEHAT